MNADPEVMRFFLAPYSLAETEAMVDRVNRHQAELGFGLLAVERPGIAKFIGYIALLVPAYEVPISGAQPYRLPSPIARSGKWSHPLLAPDGPSPICEKNVPAHAAPEHPA